MVKMKSLLKINSLAAPSREPLGVTGPARPKTNPRIVLMPPTKNRSVRGIGLPFNPSATP